VDQGVQGTSEPWGLSGSPVSLRPFDLCGAAWMLCSGDVETPSLGGEAP
jgi:hypothetical protein